MAEDKKKPERWVPGKISFADIDPDPPPLPKHFFEPDMKKDNHLRFLPPQGGYPIMSMGCRVDPEPCLACEAGVPVENKPIINTDLAQHMADRGYRLESEDGRQLIPMPTSIPTHDNAVYQIPKEGDRVVGIDFGVDDGSVLVMGIVKRLGEPNANGDIFILSEPEFVGPFPDQRKTYKVKTKSPEHVDKPRNKTAERIKALTDKYVGTLRDDPHHVPQTPPPSAIFYMNTVKEIEETERMKPSAGLLEERVEMIKERLEFLSTENAVKLIEEWKLKREQYDLYREQQRVEALLHQAKEAEMEVLQPGCDIPPEQVMCPRCDTMMVLRMAERGLMEGHEFYGCGNYPHCCGTRTVNEVEEEFPKFWKVRVRVTGSNQKRLEFSILERGEPIIGKRFAKTKFTGNSIFQDFIEPASRAVNCTLKQMVRELMIALGIKHPTVVVERMVKDMGEINPIQTVNDIMLEKLILETHTVKRFLGIKENRELFRITIERNTHREDGEDYIQLRAKDRRGQTIKSSHMPWEHLDDDYAMSCLIEEHCMAVAEELHLGHGSLDGAEKVRECLVASTKSARVVKHAVSVVHQMAMQITFKSSREMKTKFKLDKTITGRIKHGPLSSVSLVVAHPGTARDSREIELHAYGDGGADNYITSMEAHRMSSEKVVEVWFVNFAQKVAGKFNATPIGVLKLLLSEIQDTRVPEILISSEQRLLERACKTLLGDKLERSRSMQEVFEHCYSPQTKEFIEEQKRLAPQREQERRERLHKDQEDARKLKLRTRRYGGDYCNKCHREGCMCPRPTNPNDPEMHPLHTCKANEHFRLAPIPLPQQNDMDLHKGEWQYCLDCFAVIDYNGVASGRKISNLDAP